MERNNQLQVIGINFLADYIRPLSPDIKNLLATLENQHAVAIKGGIAKLCLMTVLMHEGRFKDVPRWQLEKKINDIDIVFIQDPTSPDFRQELIDKYNSIHALLEAKGLTINPRDIDIVEEQRMTEAVTKILAANDLTINEVVLVPDNGQWRLFFTPNCERHMIEGVGVFVKPKTTNIHYSAGRIFPSPLGLIRLLKFLVVGKVGKIYLPRWWLTLYFENYQKKVKAGDLPAGGPLGLYSLVLLKNYFGDNLALQNKAMVALYDLGFTDILNPDLYIKQQEAIFADANKDFELKDFTIEEVFERFLESKKRKEDSQKNRQAARLGCEHEVQTIDCSLCGKNRCIIENCVKCGRSKNPQPLPCTLRLWRGETDPSGFYWIQ